MRLGNGQTRIEWSFNCASNKNPSKFTEYFKHFFSFLLYYLILAVNILYSKYHQ